ncbi:hypothetical protein WN943_006940 [Citrus x changshan-huyou]
MYFVSIGVFLYPTYPEGANVPAFYVTLETGAYLKEYARGEAGECCIFPLSYARNKLVRKIFVWGVLLLTVISFPLVFLIVYKLYPIDIPQRHGQEQSQLCDFSSLSWGRNIVLHLPRGVSRGGKSQGPSMQTWHEIRRSTSNEGNELVHVSG